MKTIKITSPTVKLIQERLDFFINYPLEVQPTSSIVNSRSNDWPNRLSLHNFAVLSKFLYDMESTHRMSIRRFNQLRDNIVESDNFIGVSLLKAIKFDLKLHTLKSYKKVLI